MGHCHRAGSLPRAFLVVLLGASAETFAQPFVYVANEAAGNTSAYSIGAMGALTPLSPPHAGVGSAPFKIAVTQDGRFAYVANHTINMVSGYAIDALTGSWTFLDGASVAAGAGPWGVAVSPNGKFLYVTNQGESTVSGYTIGSDGSLTAIAGSPFQTPTGGYPLNLAVTPNNAFLYVVNNLTAPGSLSGFAINATTGALTAVPGSPFAAGNGPVGLAISPNGAFVYTTNANDATISGYAVNAATGALSPLAGSPFGPATYSKSDLAITPNGTFAYAVAPFVGMIGYAVNPATGAMAALAGSPVGSTQSLPSVAISPNGSFVYMTNGDGLSGTVSAFSINGATGALTAVAGSPFAAGPQAWGIAIANPAAVTSYTGPTATGSGTATVSFTGGGAACQFTAAAFIPLVGGPTSPPAGSAPSGVSFPHGLLDFTTSGCIPSGATLNFTVVYPQPLAPGTVYWKYGPTTGLPAHWYTIPAIVAGNTITFSITDGGLGDDDLAANGAVVDVGGPGAPPPGTSFYPLPPCRVGDTRKPNGPLDGPALQPGAARTFAPAGVCGIPSGAVAISANLTVTNVAAPGELVIFPSDVAMPLTSAISFSAGRTRANNDVVALSGSGTSFTVFNDSAAAVDFVFDVNGYFK